MGNAKPQPDREFIETGTEPEFFITFTRTEVAAGGNIRVYCYAERRPNQFHLLYTVIVPPQQLAEMARRNLQISADAHNLAMWEQDGASH